MFASKDTLLTRPSGYNIARSVRLRSSASAYLNRTPATASNRKTWTWSGWVKRGVFGGSQMLFDEYSAASDNNVFTVYFTSSNTLTINGYSSSWRETTQVFRDPAAWYHIVIVLDTTQATAGNRVKLYVNGVEVTSFSTTTNPTLNDDLGINQAATHTIGKYANGSLYYFDGYLTEINFVDGQALTPSSFGETDSITGVWKPKAYSGTYGTNGFELNFSDNSASTAATIGKDYSGNGNNWTPNNISVTAGATYDSMVDSPTVGATSSNYAVMNPLIKSYASQSWALTNGNLQATDSGSGGGWCLGTIAATSGKWYWEGTITANAKNHGIGWTTIGNISFGYNGCYTTNGNVNNASGSLSTTFATYTTNDVIGVAVDVSSGKVWFSKNGTFLGSGDPVAGTNTAFTFTGGTESAPTFCIDNSAGTSGVACNFGQRPFSYTPPTGFVALNTYNLPASTITNGAAYMAATLWTGNSSTQSISNAVNGVSFQPDFVWIKKRSGADDHGEFDSVRGVQKRLQPNLTNAENTETTALSSFDSGGFTLGTNGQFNGSTFTYVGWQWKAGTTSASNTNGSITSTVSAGATQGFSVVTYTGTGVTATIGHGLGVAPSMIIVKNRSAVESWRVGHSFMNGGSSPWSYYMNLNGSGAQVLESAIWNNTAPTSTVFTISNDSAVSGNGQSHVAYCFSAVAGYSAFGSYTGNGSTDGPFIYTGMRPRFVMLKRTDSTSNWYMFDTSRNTSNVMTNELLANATNVEANENRWIDCLSNGFKIRNDAGNQINASGGTFIYMAFAENPFRNALAR